jgi:hypothetical protein
VAASCRETRGEPGTKAREGNVLRITISETPTEKRWILQGRLVGPWVAALRISWKKTHCDHGGRTCIVDLTDVTSLDKGGERLLRTMSKEGAQFIATGIYIKHVLQQRCTR